MDKIDISKLLCVSTHLDNLKLKADGLGVATLKHILIDFKKLSNVVTKKIVKNAKFNTLKANVNVLEKKIPDGHVENKLPNVTGLVTTAVLNTQMSRFENKIQDHCCS